MTKALLQLGYRHTYHSEDFLFNTWTGVADEYWRREENGGAPFATIWEPAKKGTPWLKTESDLHVLNGLKHEELAQAVSRCRIDAMAFDGIEKLFWPIYEVSPGVKVISLSWRTWKEYRKSWDVFKVQLEGALWAYALLISPVHLFPWGAIVRPTLEFLTDNSCHAWLTTGGPPYTSGVETISQRMFRLSTVHRRWFTHIGGLDTLFANETEYEEYFEEARIRIPREDLFEWDMKHHGFEDLCKFLNITGPVCQKEGVLPKGVNVLYNERETPLVTSMSVCIMLALHFANYKIVCFILSLVFLAIKCLLRAVFQALRFTAMTIWKGITCCLPQAGLGRPKRD